MEIPKWLVLIGGLAIMSWLVSLTVFALCIVTAKEHPEWD